MSAKKSEKIYPSLDLWKGCDEDEKEWYSGGHSYNNMGSSSKNDYDSPRNSAAGDTDNPQSEIGEKHKHQRKYNYFLSKKKCVSFFILILVPALAFLFSYVSYETTSNKLNVSEAVEKLKQKYLKQNKSLWTNVMKIVSDNDTVHSFVLLYKSNGADGAECFAKDLVQIINNMHKNSKVIIYKSKSNVVDYGEELNKCRSIIEVNKHIIVPKLHEMNGEIARMFHTLCDVGHVSVKPSYIIFTIEDRSDTHDPGLQMKKPYERVGIILRKAWSNLAENELHPLISRIVRNVAEISHVNVSC